MEEQGKKAVNGTVDQMIKHMTADLQNSDGQYIQLGFTPPSTPNDGLSWNEYAPNQMQNPFMQHYGARSPDMLPFHVDTSGYLNQNVTFNNYMTQNQIFMSDIPGAGYDKHMSMDMHANKYVYPNPGRQYIVPNQDMAQCGYMPVYPENGEFIMFAKHDVPMQQSSVSDIYRPEPMMLPNQASVPVTPPNRTHIIENLVGNWAPNNSGTYSPFGNAQNPPLFDVKADVADLPKERAVKPVKKAKQVAEVKPMRPTYSDVLTKSAPAPKVDKVEAPPKVKNQVKKSKGADKYGKAATFNRQTSANDNKENCNGNGNGQKIADKGHEAKASLSRKWVSLDDVHDTESSEMFKDVDSSKGRKKKTEPTNANQKTDAAKTKRSFRDANTNLGCQWTEEEPTDNQTDDKNIGKNPAKKTPGKETRTGVRQARLYDKPPGSTKKNQRVRKRENNNAFVRTIQPYLSRWSKLVLCALLWFLHLVSDIFSMSVHLARDFGTIVWDSVIDYAKAFGQNVTNLLRRVKIFTKIGAYIDRTFGGYTWAFWNHGKGEKASASPDGKTWLNSGLEHNITMPLTGEEAMKRLLACKGKDPYSILGVRPDCTDDDIKRYYKRQAFLVHPDKNPQPGAEEAFKILVHAFYIIGEPERRQSYDRKVAESHQVEQAWSELNDLLSQLHQKMEYAANTIRCTNCTKRHRRLSVDRPCYAARMCSQCKIHHSAKEGDIWAESKYFGFLWHYYACMDGAVYDITEWAGCQRKNLKHLRPNSHNVQYRIVLGKQGQAGGSSGAHRRSYKGGGSNSEREADIESFLNNLYNQSDANASGAANAQADTSGRNETARSRKKNKRKK